MAVTVVVSNHAKFMQATKKIDYENDVFKAILMDSAFTFDPDAHATLADVTANQLDTEFGYTQDAKVLANVNVAEDDGNNRAAVTWDDPTWTASGGSIGPTGAIIIYDDTTPDKTVVFCGDFGVDYTITDGSSFQPQNVALDIL
jgi:hypothetical protein